MQNSGGFTMSDRNRRGKTPVFMHSAPVYNQLIGPTESLNDTYWERIMIRLKDELNGEQMTEIGLDFKSNFNNRQSENLQIYNYFDLEDTNADISRILDMIFNIIISITMFLCFFSLCAAMSANLMDQTKEIGIIRAMGFTKRRVKMLYFYEAFILVMTSCFLGVLIGTTVAFTFVLQNVVFTSLPITFFFPWAQFYAIMIVSMLCAFASTWGPTSALMKKDIAQIFRIV